MNTRMSAEFINPFLMSACVVFKNLLGVDLKKGKVSITDDLLPLEEVIFQVGMVGKVSGYVLYCMGFNVVNMIAETLVPGLSDEQIKSEYKDIVGEVANMITGNAMSHLSDQGIDITTPTVFNTSDYVVPKGRKLTVLVIKMYSPFGPLEIRICLD